MTVASTTTKVSYSGNGSTTVFTVPFYFLAAGDLRVILRSSAGVETVQTLTSQYTVTGAGVTSGGSVTMLTAPASGTTLTILRNVSPTQETDLLPNDRLPAESLETALDKATMLIQQLDEVADRALQYPASDAAVSPTLPAASARASKFLSFDASGNPVATIGTDATTSTFLQAGAGAVTRSVNDKLRDAINAKDFGVVGDGVADDSVALQAAFAAAAGKSLLIPSGAYNVGGATLSLPAGTTVSAYGAVLTWTANTTGISFAPSTTLRSYWFGGKLVGPGSSVFNNNSRAMSCFGVVSAYALLPYIQDVWITSWRGYGLIFEFTSGGRILNSRITSITYAGIAGLSSEDIKVDGNYIGQIGIGIVGDAYGCFIDRNEADLATYPLSKNCSMTNNTVEDVPNWHGLDTHGGQHFVFSNNVIRNCHRAINITGSDNASNVETWGPRFCVVSNNTITSTYTGNAISLNGATADPALGCVIANNAIYGGGTLGGGNYEGAIRLRNTQSCKVVGNTLVRPAAAGISIYLGNAALDVSGNIITNVGDTTDSAVAGITIASDGNSGYIGSNTFVYTEDWSTHNSVRSVTIASGLTNCNLTFGPSKFIGNDATHLNAALNSVTEWTSARFFSQSGSGTLSGGTLSVTFNFRFPAVPRVLVSNVSDLNPIRVSAVSETGFTATGTGATEFTYEAFI